MHDGPSLCREAPDQGAHLRIMRLIVAGQGVHSTEGVAAYRRCTHIAQAAGCLVVAEYMSGFAWGSIQGRGSV